MIKEQDKLVSEADMRTALKMAIVECNFYDECIRREDTLTVMVAFFSILVSGKYNGN